MVALQRPARAVEGGPSDSEGGPDGIPTAPYQLISPYQEVVQRPPEARGHPPYTAKYGRYPVMRTRTYKLHVLYVLTLVNVI